MSTLYDVGIGISVFICKDGKILMQKRRGAHGSESWADPGGKMSYGESPEQAGIREVKEETDLDVSNLQFLGYTNDVFEADGLHYITLHYATNTFTGTPIITEPNKCSALEWFGLGELPSPLFLPPKTILKDAFVLQKLNELLAKNLNTPN